MIAFTPQLAARLVALGVAMVILQVAAVSQIELFGTNADLGPLVVAAVGLMVGSLPGAIFGFATGLFLDLALVQTVGLSSLVYLAVGYGAGRWLELRDPQGALVRRWLTPALPEDPRRRRRRAYTTGGLSPLSRS